MEVHLTLTAIALILRAINFGRFMRLLFFRISYPNASLEDLENFERNTSSKLHKIGKRKSKNQKY